MLQTRFAWFQGRYTICETGHLCHAFLMRYEGQLLLRKMELDSFSCRAAQHESKDHKFSTIPTNRLCDILTQNIRFKRFVYCFAEFGELSRATQIKLVFDRVFTLTVQRSGTQFMDAEFLFICSTILWE